MLVIAKWLSSIASCTRGSSTTFGGPRGPLAIEGALVGTTKLVTWFTIEPKEGALGGADGVAIVD